MSIFKEGLTVSIGRRLLSSLALIAGFLVTVSLPAPAAAYIGGPPGTLGLMCSWSTHVMIVKVERFDRDKGVVIFRKVQDVKGKWPVEVIRQRFAPALAQQLRIMDWAEAERTTVMFALESYRWSHTYIDGAWYAANTGDWQWWNVAHVEPLLLRWYSGRATRLADSARAILAGKEVVVPCMDSSNPEELRLGKARKQRLKASLKLLDYNPKRDFVAWGGDDLVHVAGMAGFTHYSPLPPGGAEAQAISAADFDGDGKLDLCLAGASRVVLLRNGGDYFSEVQLPGLAGGCRAAVWADYNGDGKPDLLVATPLGPRLFTNLGGGSFRDDSALLPSEPAWTLTAAAWIDYDGDGRPDLLLANGYHGLRLYRNLGLVQNGKWFEDVSVQVGLGRDGLGAGLKGDTLTVCDVNGDGRPDFLYGAGTGMLVLNRLSDGGMRFVEGRDSGIIYTPGGVGPVFGDFNNDGHPDLFVPQKGGCKLFKNDGKGKFTDVTAQAGALAHFTGWAACACWGDFDNDGRLDLMVGCLRGTNRFFRNKGDGTFEDATEAVGLHQKVYNTQAVCLVDLNGDGVLDLVMNNEGQESAVLLGNPAVASKRVPVTIQVAGKGGVVGSRVQVSDKAGKALQVREICGGSGRGGQPAPLAHFALEPGTYRVQVRYSSGVTRAREIRVTHAPLRSVIDDQTKGK
jgi:hypothetical protein